MSTTITSKPKDLICKKHGNIGNAVMTIRAFTGDVDDSYCTRCYKEMLEPIKVTKQ